MLGRRRELHSGRRLLHGDHSAAETTVADGSTRPASLDRAHEVAANRAAARVGASPRCRQAARPARPRTRHGHRRRSAARRRPRRAAGRGRPAVGAPTRSLRRTLVPRYGVRILRRSPRFSVAVVLILGLGVGMTTAVFAIVDSHDSRSASSCRRARSARMRSAGGAGATRLPSSMKHRNALRGVRARRRDEPGWRGRGRSASCGPTTGERIASTHEARGRDAERANGGWGLKGPRPRPASGDHGPENERCYQLNCVESRSIRPST